MKDSLYRVSFSYSILGRGKRTIVSSIIAPYQVSKSALRLAFLTPYWDVTNERSFSITPIVSSTKDFRSVDLGDVLTHAIVQFAEVHLLQRFMARSLMHSHIEGTEVELSEVEQGIIHMLGLEKVINQFVRNVLGRLFCRSPVKRLLVSSLEL